VGIVGDAVLPIAEIDFGALPAEAWPIISYRAKWETGSAEDIGTKPVCPALIEPVLEAEVAAAALAAWRAIEGRGYGRVDVRVASDGTPFVLEVNPNPDLSPFAGLARMARAGGWTYSELIARILEEAILRPHRDERSAMRMHSHVVTEPTGNAAGD
jgi:D-alanine-D-alanine ligase